MWSGQPFGKGEMGCFSCFVLAWPYFSIFSYTLVNFCDIKA